jgi:hypothetical protein
MPAAIDSAISRRQFCGHFATSILAVPWALLATHTLAQAGEKVDEGEPAAVGLGYRHDATQVDTAAFPKRAGAQGARQFCQNCALFEGEASDGWAPCSMFQGQLVAGTGWCNAWVSRS